MIKNLKFIQKRLTSSNTFKLALNPQNVSYCLISASFKAYFKQMPYWLNTG